jgi:WD40 repeat protein
MVVTFSPDGRTIAMGGVAADDSGCIELWKLDGAEDASLIIEGHATNVNDLVFLQMEKSWHRLRETTQSNYGMSSQTAVFKP